MSMILGKVEEFSGLESPFVFSELLLQRIWLRGLWSRRGARLADGRPLEVLHPGRWNRLAGPDFKGARLRIAGQTVEGDVELHLQTSDWDAHGHARDLAYGGVRLHVVLFHNQTAAETHGWGGGGIPLLELLPLLPSDLESFALDDAAERLAGVGRMDAYEDLARLQLGERRALLAGHARRRWEAKLSHARLRLNRLGWVEACHHAALECLGYRFNRAVMLDVAGRYPYADWIGAKVDPGQVWSAFAGRWRLHGVRPANLPKLRLNQYLRWCFEVQDWPARLLARDFKPLVFERPGRRPKGLANLRAMLDALLCAAVLSGPRFDTFLIDAAFPLLGAQRPCLEPLLQDYWRFWWTGDVGGADLEVLKGLGLLDDGSQFICNELRQGLMGWGLAKDLALVSD